MARDWTKARRIRGAQDVNDKDPRHVYSSTYFRKLKAKAIELAKKNLYNPIGGIYDLQRFDGIPKAQRNKCSPHISYGSYIPQGNKELELGVTSVDKDWQSGTGTVLKPETSALEVGSSISITFINNRAIIRSKRRENT